MRKVTENGISYKPKYENLRDAYEEFKALKESAKGNNINTSKERRRSRGGQPGAGLSTERRYINIQDMVDDNVNDSKSPARGPLDKGKISGRHTSNYTTLVDQNH